MTVNLPADNKQRVQSLSFWKQEGLSGLNIEALDGGITNHNYLVSAAADDVGADNKAKFVVRLGDDIPVHHILRFHEVGVSKAAHAAGLSPAIRHSESGAIVMDYIESTALTPEQVRDPEMFANVLQLVKQCHQKIPEFLRGASVVFWVFHVIRDYAGSLRDGQSVHQTLLPELLAASDELETAAGPFDIVFGHNDLLAANVLDAGDRLWLIDWEYGGFNTPLFDLGGLASNNEITEVQERWMLETYFEAPLNDELWRRYEAMKTASLLRETMWSMISEIHSTLEFDYSVYTAENLQRFETSLANFRQL